MAANIKEHNVLAFLRSQPNHTSAKSKIAQHFGSADPTALNPLFQRLETKGQIRKLGRHSLVLKKNALSGFSTDGSNVSETTNHLTVSEFVRNCNQQLVSSRKEDLQELLAYVQSVAKEILQNKNKFEEQFRDAVKACLCEFDAQTKKYKGSDANCKEKCEGALNEFNTTENELGLENTETNTKYFYFINGKATAEEEFLQVKKVFEEDKNQSISTEASTSDRTESQDDDNRSISTTALTSDRTESQLSNSQAKTMFQKVITEAVNKAKGTFDYLEKKMVPESPDSRLDFVMFIFYGLMSRLYLLNAAHASSTDECLECSNPDGYTDVWAFVTLAQIIQVISVIGTFLSLIAIFLPKK